MEFLLATVGDRVLFATDRLLAEGVLEAAAGGAGTALGQERRTQGGRPRAAERHITHSVSA